MHGEHRRARETIREAYEDPETVARYSRDTHLWKSEQVLIDRYFPHGGRVLDLGCGAGRTSIPMAATGFRVVGIDVSGAMLELGRQRAVDAGVSVDWAKMDATELAFADERFDAAIFAFNAMDHMPGFGGKLQVLHEVYRILRPGSPFLFSTHRIWSPFLWPALLRASIRLEAGRLLGWSVPEREWGEIYEGRSRTREGRYGHFLSPRRWAEALRLAGFELHERTLRARTRTDLAGPPHPQGHRSRQLRVLCGHQTRCTNDRSGSRITFGKLTKQDQASAHAIDNTKQPARHE